MSIQLNTIIDIDCIFTYHYCHYTIIYLYNIHAITIITDLRTADGIQITNTICLILFI